MNDFYIEQRLKAEAPELHRRMKDSVLVLQQMLHSFTNWFPFFTDHSILHSLDVLQFCNWLLDAQAAALTPAECYVLVMACYLHDVGMGVSRENYAAFAAKVNLADYMAAHPDASDQAIIRAFHNEFSGLMIHRYARLFEFPSDDFTFAVAQTSRGHRKTDLLDPVEYPDIETPWGVIRTAFLAAVIRLADEIDMGADRNHELLFDPSNLPTQWDIDIFCLHESIPTVEVTPDAVILHTRPKAPRILPMIAETADKMQATLDYCRYVAEQRSDLRITQARIEVRPVADA